MKGIRMSQLPEAQPEDSGDLLVMSDGANKRMRFDSLGEYMWNHMYTHSKKVIVSCEYCASHNAISNAVCVQCGAPMGE